MPKKISRAERQALAAKARAAIIPEIVRLEKQWGESAVSGAFARHVEIRRARRNLLAIRRETNEKIRSLSR